MSTLDDLRATLDSHADDAVAHDLGGRTASVRDRIRVARRRRRAGAAGAVGAVAAAVAAAVLVVPDGPSAGPDPAGPTVYGIDVPTELTSLGYTYDYEKLVTGADGRARLTGPASDQPRLVSWSTSGPDDAVTITERGAPSGGPRESGDFDDWVLIDAGEPLDVVATVAEGEPALAVYTLGETRPDGVTGAGTTYRRSIAEGELLDAVIGEPGVAEVTLDVTATTAGVRLYDSCGGLEGTGLWLHFRSLGDPGDSGGGVDCSSLPVDGTTGSTSSWTSTPGETISTRFWVTRGPDGPLVDDPDFRLAVAYYALDRDPFAPLEEFPRLREHDGHTWELLDTDVRPRGEALDATAPEGVGPVYAVIAVASGAVRTDFEFRFGEQATGSSIPEDNTSGSDAIVAGGTPVTAEVARGDRDGARMAVGYYVRAD